MFSELQDALGNYLLPFLIAVPLAIVVYFCTRGRDDELLGKPAAREEDTAPRRPRSVLVVDDSAVARTKLVKLFESGGFEVGSARDGVEALEVLATRKFDVLVTD
ncbi:MAG TPA: response regulator, partial [Burkholderiaceae bacterium]